MTYFLLKFIHITAAIFWIGGVFTLSILNLRFIRNRERDMLAAFAEQSEFFGKFIIGPSAGITLIAGIIMVAIAWQAAPFWIIWGFVAMFVSMGLGGGYTRRLGNKLATLISLPDYSDKDVNALQRKLTTWNTINLLILLSAVWVMVFKPTL